MARIIDRANDTVGRYIAWLALFMVLVQFVVVVMRYVFGLGSTVMQESIVYMHAIVFLAAAWVGLSVFGIVGSQDIVEGQPIAPVSHGVMATVAICSGVARISH